MRFTGLRRRTIGLDRAREQGGRIGRHVYWNRYPRPGPGVRCESESLTTANSFSLESRAESRPGPSAIPSTRDPRTTGQTIVCDRLKPQARDQLPTAFSSQSMKRRLGDLDVRTDRWHVPGARFSDRRSGCLSDGEQVPKNQRASETFRAATGTIPAPAARGRRNCRASCVGQIGTGIDRNPARAGHARPEVAALTGLPEDRRTKFESRRATAAHARMSSPDIEEELSRDPQAIAKGHQQRPTVSRSPSTASTTFPRTSGSRSSRRPTRWAACASVPPSRTS